MTIKTRNWVVVFLTTVLLVLLVLYLWSPRFLQNLPDSGNTPLPVNLFATSTPSLSGTIVEITEDGFILEIPPTALEHGAPTSLYTRTVTVSPETRIVRLEAVNQQVYDQDVIRHTALQAIRNLSLEEYESFMASTSMYKTPTTTVLSRVGDIDPNKPVVYLDVPKSDFTTVVASATVRLASSSTHLLEQPPASQSEVQINREALQVGNTVAVVAAGSIYGELEIRPTTVVVLD